MVMVLNRPQQQDNFTQQLMQLGQLLSQSGQQRQQNELSVLQTMYGMQQAQENRNWEQEKYQAEQDWRRQESEWNRAHQDRVFGLQERQTNASLAAANRPAAIKWDINWETGQAFDPTTGQVIQVTDMPVSAFDQYFSDLIDANTPGQSQPQSGVSAMPSTGSVFDAMRGFPQQASPQPQPGQAPTRQAGLASTESQDPYQINLPGNMTYGQVAALASYPGDKGEPFRNLLTQMGKVQDLRGELKYEPDLMAFTDKTGGIFPLSPEMQNQIYSNNLTWNSSLEEYVDSRGHVVPVVWPENYQPNKQEMDTTLGKPEIVLDDINRALGMISAGTAGLGGAVLSNVPGSPARNLQATLDTIKANSGFNILQEMRAKSPTGGALGQVSDTENRLLQSVLGSLDQSQSEEALRYNLERYRTLFLDIVHGSGNWRINNDGSIAVDEGIGQQQPDFGNLKQPVQVPTPGQQDGAHSNGQDADYVWDMNTRTLIPVRR